MKDKIVCIFNKNLILADFDGGDGGADYYVDYQNAELITENVHDDGELSHYGILITDSGENFRLLEYSWDGFQRSELEGIDALKKIGKLASYIID